MTERIKLRKQKNPVSRGRVSDNSAPKDDAYQKLKAEQKARVDKIQKAAKGVPIRCRPYIS